jgi:hypothetical protein
MARNNLRANFLDLSEQLAPTGLDPIQDLQLDGNPVKVTAVPEMGAQAVGVPATLGSPFSLTKR